MTLEKEGTKNLNGADASELDRLATLQGIDRRLQDKTELAAALEREVSEMDAELAAQREVVAALQAEREIREQRRRELEARLEEEERKMKDRRMRLNRVRNEKELGALRREIELGKEANQQMEAELLTVLEAVEALDARLAESTQALAAAEERHTTGCLTRRERIGALTSEVEGERGMRDRLASSLSEELRGKYEQIFARRGGTTVVEIRNGTCMGCHMQVPPQFFNELQKTRAVRLCPNCHRILFWRPEPAEAPQSPTR